MFIYRPEYYHLDQDADGHSTEGLAEINLAKHRSGAQAKIQLRFRGEYARFENLPEDDPNTASPFAMPANDQFDQNGGGHIMEFDSKMNHQPDNLEPDDQLPY